MFEIPGYKRTNNGNKNVSKNNKLKKTKTPIRDIIIDAAKETAKTKTIFFDTCKGVTRDPVFIAPDSEVLCMLLFMFEKNLYFTRCPYKISWYDARDFSSNSVGGFMFLYNICFNFLKITRNWAKNSRGMTHASNKIKTKRCPEAPKTKATNNSIAENANAKNLFGIIPG
ncbi:MAG: hypothetical protein K8Q89_01455 [Nitrosarchaeum sp.]|nr:hypothetical protein [Nitrosarchaeum sp.]